MKKFLLFFLFLNFISFQIKSQQVIFQKQNFAHSGQNFLMAVDYFSESENKHLQIAGSMYDFSNSVADKIDTFRFKNSKNTPFFEKRFQNTELAMLTSTEYHHFYTFHNDTLVENGCIGDFLKIKESLMLRYDSAFIRYVFPLQLGDKFNSETRKSIKIRCFSIPNIDSIRAEIRISSESEFLNIETVHIPLGTFRCLREQNLFYFSVKAFKFSSLSGGWSPAPELSHKDSTIFYRWFAENSGFPIAEAQMNTKSLVKKISVQYDSPLKMELKSVDALCKNTNTGKIVAKVSGGIPDYTFSLANGETTNLENLKAGIYAVTVTDNRNRKLTQNVSVNEPKEELTIKVQKKDVTCASKRDGEIEIQVQGGTPEYLYQWSVDSISTKITRLLPDTYRIRVIDKNHCIKTETIVIEEPQNKLTVSLTSTSAKCKSGNDGTLTANAKGGTSPYQYEWSNGAKEQTAENLAAGKYSVKVIDQRGCFVTGNGTVKEPRDKLFFTSTSKHIRCNGAATGEIALQIKGGVKPYKILWSNQSKETKLKNICAGEYFVQIIDSMGCKIYGNFTLTEPDSLKINYFAELPTNYSLGKIEVQGEGGEKPYIFLWKNQKIHNEIDSLKPKNYEITLVDSTFCSVSQKISLIPVRKAQELYNQNVFLDFRSARIPQNIHYSELIYIEIYDIFGKLLYNEKISTNIYPSQIFSLREGIYFYIISDEKHIRKFSATFSVLKY